MVNLCALSARRSSPGKEGLSAGSLVRSYWNFMGASKAGSVDAHAGCRWPVPFTVLPEVSFGGNEDRPLYVHPSPTSQDDVWLVERLVGQVFSVRTRLA